MSDAQAVPEPTETPKKGRGPTRPMLVMADLFDAIVKAGIEEEMLDALTHTTNSAARKARLRECRVALAEYIRRKEEEFGTEEMAIGALATAEKLPEHARTLLETALRDRLAETKAEEPKDGKTAAAGKDD